MTKNGAPRVSAGRLAQPHPLQAFELGYRYRYLDGWREKETRGSDGLSVAALEKALGAYFSQEDSAAVLFKEWNAYRDGPFEYRKGESWDRLFRQGVHLLENLCAA